MRNSSAPRPDIATTITMVGERIEIDRKKKTKKGYFKIWM